MKPEDVQRPPRSGDWHGFLPKEIPEGQRRVVVNLAKLFKGVEDVKGRWRGSRLLGTSEIRYEDWPTTEEVLERGTDISDKVLRYLVAISHF